MEWLELKLLPMIQHFVQLEPNDKRERKQVQLLLRHLRHYLKLENRQPRLDI